jgi:beta-lactamase class A
MRFGVLIRGILGLNFLLPLVPALPAQDATQQDTPQQAQESPARSQVEQIARQNGADMALAFRSLDGGQELYIQADKQFRAPSTVAKLPIMIELYAEAQAGELRLSDTITVHNGFVSPLGGETFQLDPRSDPDPDFYKSIGTAVTLGDLCDHMSKKDSDLAADLLIEKLGLDRIRQRIHALHVDGLELRRGFGETTVAPNAPANTTSARALMELLWVMANGQVINSDVSQQMIGIIANSDAGGANAGLPSDARTAHMSANVTGIQHEELIVYGAHSFVEVVIVPNSTSPDATAGLMALVTHALAAGLQ